MEWISLFCCNFVLICVFVLSIVSFVCCVASYCVLCIAFMLRVVMVWMSQWCRMTSMSFRRCACGVLFDSEQLTEMAPGGKCRVLVFNRVNRKAVSIQTLHHLRSLLRMRGIVFFTRKSDLGID
jgi:hypothetical protein